MFQAVFFYGGIFLSFAFISPEVDIFVIVLAVSIVMQIVQRKFLDKKRMKMIQQEMREKSKKLNEMAKQGKSETKEAKELQGQVMTLMSESFKGMPKQMLFSMAIYVPVFFVVGALYADAVIATPFPVPWLSGEEGSIIKLFTETNWFGYYVLMGLIVSIVIGIVLKVFEKVKK